MGAAYSEAMIRTLFGYNPTWNTWNNMKNKNDVINAFMNTNTSRNWDANIFGLRTPIGFVDVFSGNEGVEITNITAY